MRIFLVLAALGLVVSLAVHLSTFVGLNPSPHSPVMLLHLGIFVVFLPAILTANRAMKGRSKNDAWKLATTFAPAWLRRFVAVSFVYALLNFFLFFLLSERGQPAIVQGEMVLQNHGQVIRRLNAVEFAKQQAYVVRGFSGHWILFYGASLMMIVVGDRIRRAREADSASVA
jgi:hypothetical protein